jgi:hypothetical protein
MVHHLFAGLTGLKPKVGGFAKKRVKKGSRVYEDGTFFRFVAGQAWLRRIALSGSPVKSTLHG